MNLFINSVSKNWILILFDDKRNILKQKKLQITWNESSQLIPNIKEFLEENNIDFFDIKNIVLVNWPWSFTWLRTSSLVVNTISFITDAFITDISYFDLFSNYPIIKSSSKHDSFFKKCENCITEILNNECLEKSLEYKGIKSIYGEWDLKNIEIIEKIDYSDIINKIKLLDKKRITPFYGKKPNIC